MFVVNDVKRSAREKDWMLARHGGEGSSLSMRLGLRRSREDWHERGNWRRLEARAITLPRARGESCRTVADQDHGSHRWAANRRKRANVVRLYYEKGGALEASRLTEDDTEGVEDAWTKAIFDNLNREKNRPQENHLTEIEREHIWLHSMNCRCIAEHEGREGRSEHMESDCCKRCAIS